MLISLEDSAEDMEDSSEREDILAVYVSGVGYSKIGLSLVIQWHFVFCFCHNLYSLINC